MKEIYFPTEKMKKVNTAYIKGAILVYIYMYVYNYKIYIYMYVYDCSLYVCQLVHALLHIFNLGKSVVRHVDCWGKK